MRLKKASSVDYVHQFTDMAFMKFKPRTVNVEKEQSDNNESVIMSRIKQYIGWKPSSTSSRATQQSRTSAISRSSSQVSIRSISLKEGHLGSSLLFLEKITPQHYLIGNANQLDLVNIGGVVGNFIDTESLWQLNIGKPILRLAIEAKKGYIAIETQSQIVVYKYDYKKIKERPQFLCGIKTKQEATYMHFSRDSILCIFRGSFLDVYTIEEKSMKKKVCKQFKEAADMELFQVPPPIDGCINVFFVKKSETIKTFQLWYKQIDFASGINNFQNADLMKVYDIKEGLEKKIKMENYSREIFLMNLGFEILACKKGYIIDSAFLNLQEESTFLHYIGNNRLLHLSTEKAEIYRFGINLALNPSRIEISSLDSIEIKKPKNYEYIGALEMFNRNFAVFYQVRPDMNFRARGEIAYCLAITKHLTIEEKVKEIFTFPLGTDLKTVELARIEEKVDMAKKIGLNRIEVYLELWNRTNKETVEEFQFLLDTLDYTTIKKEIEKKLKKASMYFREIYKIEQSCFDMVRANLFSSNCSEEVIRDYLTSHLLLRKLELYRDISVYEKEHGISEAQRNERGAPDGHSGSSEALKINIQDYNKYLKADVKNLFLQMVNGYCLEGKNLLGQIRVFLRKFRFIFRIIYRDLLEDIVSNTKGGLIKLLRNFPELLPYRHLLSDADDPTLYEGVWEDISRTEWELNLHVEGISTIDNRELVAEVHKTLWFRRYFLTQHDMTNKSNEQIVKIHRSNNSDEIFYFFISKVFQYVEDPEALTSIISYTERSYERMPEHISHKIFLYRRIFEYIRHNNLSRGDEKLSNFHELLKLKDYELFKEFFVFERTLKGCLLREIKKIYEEVGGMEEKYVLEREHELEGEEYTKTKLPAQGTVWFNEGLLSYFSSEVSEVSDLKYILNRINSEKREFHAENESLVLVLVQSLQLKLKIGSENDVPINEVLVYLETIPITPENPVLEELERIQKINEEAERLAEIQLNLTISEIMGSCETVINALINNEIAKKGVMELQSIEEVKDVSYDIIAEIQIVKEKIYRNEFSDLTFFVYLTKIMEQMHMIPFAAQLLQDEYLVKYFSVDQKVVEDLILYMYKLKLSQNPRYVDNEQYLTQLLQILQEDNECRIYIQCELHYAKLMSAPGQPIEYPLTDQSDGISILQIEERVQELPGDFLLSIDIESLHATVNKMQEICYEDFEVQFYTTLNEIYEVIILKLIRDNKIPGAIALTKKLLSLPNNPYGIVFPLFFIDLISQELTIESKRNFLKAVSFLFQEPLELIKVVETVMGQVVTNAERGQYFRDLVERSSEYKRNYNPKNPILDPTYLELIRNEEMENNFREMVDQCGSHIVKTKDEFGHFEFSLLFVILTQNPYAFAKYIYCKKYTVNYKVMRSFLSYVIKEDIFDSLRVLEFGRRLFNIIAQASSSLFTLENVVSQYSEVGMEETVEFEELEPTESVLPSDDESVKKFKIFDAKLQKCISAFDKKKSSVLEELNEKGPQVSQEQRRVRIEKQLINPIDLSEKAPSEYPFVDSDDDYGEEEKFQDIRVSKRKKVSKGFDPSHERNLLMNRTSKNYAMFMSTENQKDDGHAFKMSGRIGLSATHRKLKTAKSMAMNPGQSLRMTEGAYQGNDMQVSGEKQQKMSYFSNRISEEVDLVESVEGFYPRNKSTVIQRKVENLGLDDAHSPTGRISFNKSSGSFEDSENEEFHHSEGFRSISNTEKYGKNQQEEDDFLKGTEQKSIDIEGQAPHQETTEFDGGFQVVVNEVDENDFMPIKEIKSIIFESVAEVNGELTVNLSQLSKEEDKENGMFTEYLMKLVESIYEDSRLSAKERLKVIKQIEGLYPDIGISKENLETYMRFESYHSKYDIAIPMAAMFPIAGIFLEQGGPKALFRHVMPGIVQLVDESNIYKVSKIIHLAFKASSFEHEFFFSYLCIAVKSYDDSTQTESELQMNLEKLTALIEKIPLSLLLEKGGQIVQAIKGQERKEAIIGSICNYVKKKRSLAEAERMDKKLRAL